MKMTLHHPTNPTNPPTKTNWVVLFTTSYRTIQENNNENIKDNIKHNIRDNIKDKIMDIIKDNFKDIFKNNFKDNFKGNFMDTFNPITHGGGGSKWPATSIEA